MPILDDKLPWESGTEMVAFVSMIASLLVAFNLIQAPLTAEQIAGIASLLFLIVLIVRKTGTGGKIVFSKPKPPAEMKDPSK